MDEPFVAIGTDELDGDVGDYADCRICGGKHRVCYGDRILNDGTKEPSKLLAFFKCDQNGKTYLHGINGRIWK